MTNVNDLMKNIRVGPVMRAGEAAEAVKEAAHIDNPGRNIIIEDMNAYVRIFADDHTLESKT